MGNNQFREERRLRKASQRVKQVNVFMVGLNGSGKSSILYRHMTGNTYSSQMNILQTITYNCEKVKPPKVTLCNDDTNYDNNNNNNNIIKNTVFTVYDYGGSKEARTFWVNHNIPKLKTMDLLILVIDSCDLDRMNNFNYDCIQTACKEILNKKTYLKAPLCIFANKQDLPNALSCNDIQYKIGIKQISCWDLMSFIRFIHKELISWEIGYEIMSFLPKIDQYWNLKQRPWVMIPCNAIDGDGVNEGMQWLYQQYCAKNAKKTKKKHRNNRKTKSGNILQMHARGNSSNMSGCSSSNSNTFTSTANQLSSSLHHSMTSSIFQSRTSFSLSLSLPRAFSPKTRV